MRRPTLAVLGGSFNPPHLGHALVPTYVLARGLADRVLVAPCWSHPFAKSMAPFADRLAWTRLAMAGQGERVVVSDVEARLAARRGEGPSYTIELLEALAREHPGWVVRPVIGTDIVARGELARWHEGARLERDFPPIVVPRAGYGAEGGALPEISSTAVRGWLARAEEPEARARLAEAVPAAVLAALLRPRQGVIWLVGHGHVASHAEPWLRGRGWSVRVIGGRELVAGRVEVAGRERSEGGVTGMSGGTGSRGEVAGVSGGTGARGEDAGMSGGTGSRGEAAEVSGGTGARGEVAGMSGGTGRGEDAEVSGGTGARGEVAEVSGGTGSRGEVAEVSGGTGGGSGAGGPDGAGTAERPTGIWVLCRDGALPAVSEALGGALRAVGWGDVPVLHAAGAVAARSERGLGALARGGTPVGTLHPICSLRAEAEGSRLGEATFGIEGDPAARALALRLVEEQGWLDLEGLGTRERTAYHAACALAANHVAVLLGEARGILVGQGHAAAQVEGALGTLLRSALENLLALGIPAGVSGPAARGEWATVAAHAAALEGEAGALYAMLARRLGALVGEGAGG